jgi:hypothetical protein
LTFLAGTPLVEKARVNFILGVMWKGEGLKCAHVWPDVW